MLAMEVNGYGEGERFFQIGKDGDEWKMNNYEGYYSRSADKYYKIKGVNPGENRTSRFVSISEKGKQTDTLEMKFAQESYLYIIAFDQSGSVYIDRQYFDGMDNIVKCDKQGKLLAIIDTNNPDIDEKYYSDIFPKI